MPETEGSQQDKAPLLKGVIRIDGLSSQEIRSAIKEHKILFGTKEELAEACEQGGLTLPQKGAIEAKTNDAWLFNASRTVKCVKKMLQTNCGLAHCHIQKKLCIETLLDNGPIDCFHERLDIIRALDAVVGDICVFKDIHDE